MKVNCDAAFLECRAALAFVVRDDTGLLVVARSKLLRLSSASEAETKCDIPRKNYCFSSDALVVVNDINSSKDPTVWSTREVILKARHTFVEKEWKLSWNGKISNRFTDFVEKLALKGNCNVVFFSFNLNSLLKERLKS